LFSPTLLAISQPLEFYHIFLRSGTRPCAATILKYLYFYLSKNSHQKSRYNIRLSKRSAIFAMLIFPIGSGLFFRNLILNEAIKLFSFDFWHRSLENRTEVPE